MAVSRGNHHSDRGRVEQEDDAQLQQAEVVAEHAHAGLLSMASRDSAGARSDRATVSSAIESTPDHTSVAMATCRPLKSASSVSAEPAPTATWSPKTAMVAIATSRSWET